MKILKITTPSGGKIQIPESQWVTLQSTYIRESNGKVIGRMIDGNLHLVPDKDEPQTSHNVPPQIRTE